MAIPAYKLFMVIIQRRLTPWIVDTQRLSPRQKGSLPRNGLQEHVYTLSAGIRDFLHQSTKLFICFIDIKDAFGSLDHNIMINSLKKYYYPDVYINIINDTNKWSKRQKEKGIEFRNSYV